jgi:uncharacterized protein YndB with AHSA1/START domain
MRYAEFTIERALDAPVAQVYRAWTDPELLARWIWAGMGTSPWAEVDPRVGGAYRAYTNVKGGRHEGEGWSGMCGVYAVVEPERRLVLTLHWDADVEYNQAPDALVLDEVLDVTFAPDGVGGAGDSGTKLTVTHRGIPDDGKSVEGHRAGMALALDVLAKLLGE